jgi:GT2 family glycosyltransferase
MTVSNISVIILHYRQEEYLKECLRSLSQTKCLFQEIIVVHNDLESLSFQSIRMEFPQIVVLNTGKNLGYAGGMNAGIRYAQKMKPEFLLIMNCDTLVTKETVPLLFSALESHPSAALATATIFYHPEVEKVWYGGGYISFMRALGRHNHACPSSMEVQRVSFISGCAFLAKNSVLCQLGMFDERFFMYMEDLELSNRLQRAGYELLYVPKALIYHRKQSETVTPFTLYFIVRNRLLFIKLCISGLSKMRTLVLLFIELAIKAALWSVSRPYLLKSIIYGLEDYSKGCYGIGRGKTFLRKDQ